MDTRRFASRIKRASEESEDVFGSLRAVNRSIYGITSHIYGIRTEDQADRVEDLRVIVERLERATKRLEENVEMTVRLRDPFLLDRSAPSLINQGLAIGYARMANRYFHKAHVNARRLYKHVMKYLDNDRLNSLEKIRLFAKIYDRFIDAESFLCQGTFALRIAYNHALSRAIMKHLISNPLAEKDLRKGDIILSYKTSPYLQHHRLARFIAFAEHKNITHSAMVYAVGGSHVTVLAASGDAGVLGTFEIKPLHGEFWFVFRPDVTTHQYAKLREIMDRWVGEVHRRPQSHKFSELKSWFAVIIGYLFAEIVLHSSVIVMIPNVIHSNKDYFCSDIIDSMFKEVGIHLVPRSRNDGVIGPAELFYSPYLKNIGVFFNQGEEADIRTEDWSI